MSTHQKTRWVIFDNDEKQGICAYCADIENVFRFFKDKESPELFAVRESIDDEPGKLLNGQVWLEENECPCCGNTRGRPYTEDEEKALDDARPGPRY